MNLLQMTYSVDSGISLMQLVFIFCIIIVVSTFIKGSKIKAILAHEHSRFETTPFTPQEFYQLLKDLMKQKEITHVFISGTTYSQGGLLSPRRDYLHIQYKEFVYIVCAAPFAKEFFVSWWLGEQGSPLRDFFVNLPALGKLFSKRKKTFYDLDTEIMFKEAVKACIRDALAQLENTKGIRQLATGDWATYENVTQAL